MPRLPPPASVSSGCNLGVVSTSVVPRGAVSGVFDWPTVVSSIERNSELRDCWARDTASVSRLLALSSFLLLEAIAHRVCNCKALDIIQYIT